MVWLGKCEFLGRGKHGVCHKNRWVWSVGQQATLCCVQLLGVPGVAQHKHRVVEEDTRRYSPDAVVHTGGMQHVRCAECRHEYCSVRVTCSYEQMAVRYKDGMVAASSVRVQR